jgi:nitrogen fixation protein NifX
MRRLRLVKDAERSSHLLSDQSPGGTMKVAFATQDMQRVDAHFGWAKNIAIYELNAEDYHFLEAVQFDGELAEDGNEDKLAPKLEAIRDCAILYVAAIGGSGAARVVAMKIHPIKVNEPESIHGILDKLQVVLQGTPPPWLRKLLNKDAGRTFHFDEEEEFSHA